MEKEIAQISWWAWTLGVLPFAAGYFMKLFSDLLLKSQERRNSLEKIVIEKRLSAYEDIISIIKSGNVAYGVFVENEVMKYPFILDSLETFYEWYHNFVNTCTRTRYLIDSKLDYRLWLLNNYLHNLDRLLNQILVMRETSANNQNREKIKSEEWPKLVRIGELIYPDIKKLTSDVLEEASNFFSTGIYEVRFSPSTLRGVEYPVPADFSQLALFSRSGELHNLAKLKIPNP